MNDREALIFVQPNGQDFKKCATTVLGELAGTIRDTTFDWCWAAKYTPEWTADARHYRVPERFKVMFGQVEHSSFVKFRYRTDDPDTFESAVQEIAKGRGWHAAFGDYNLVEDLGTPRFLAAEQGSSTHRRTERADLLARFLYQALLLALDALVKDGNDWRFERSTDAQNPTQSTFQSIVHLVCNLTDAKTLAAVTTPAGTFPVVVSF